MTINTTKTTILSEAQQLHNGILFWVARVLSVPALLLLVLAVVEALFVTTHMHLVTGIMRTILNAICLVGLVFSWRHKAKGAYLALAAVLLVGLLAPIKTLQSPRLLIPLTALLYLMTQSGTSRYNLRNACLCGSALLAILLLAFTPCDGIVSQQFYLITHTKEARMIQWVPIWTDPLRIHKGVFAMEVFGIITISLFVGFITAPRQKCDTKASQLRA